MKIQRIRDPLHNLIEFRHDDELERALWQVLESRPFQRLRRVKQLGFSDLVYPGASHSRFAHSVGVFHTARRLMEVVRKHVGHRQETRENLALAAALVHDLGHGAFSHAFEKVGERLQLKLADHEHMSDRLIRSGEVAGLLNTMGSGFASDVADIIKKEGRKSVHNAVVSSQFDADRLDYMRRDRLMTGTQHAAIDFEWLVANLDLAEVPVGVDDSGVGTIETFVIGPKAIHATEAFVLGLFQLYPTVYLHKTTRGIEKLFAELLVRIVSLARNASATATGLPVRHPLILFAQSPDDIETALCLDDTVVWGGLSLMVDAKDPVISQLATRLRDRKLYKCIDIRARVAHAFNPASDSAPELVAAIDRCCARIDEKLKGWIDGDKSVIPRLLIDEAERSPYKTAGGSTGPTEQINVRTDGGATVDLKQRSRVVAALTTFKLFRAYYGAEDESARQMVEGIISGEIAACR
ncbi:HD domain-containing protein [Labrys wisconsinensis]|uniref:HD superfamily phosphohydrolase n=1 Tax=Labrys wisconsinensis TaxID=425677 RepID=A0ABU0J9G0_9HYPH|nr:HD domain-containing protein [Labrys wisconsinensis]MDQ0469802.1 HD superfamily phosphohydrolase [Labrys wisconsinensis]